MENNILPLILKSPGEIPPQGNHGSQANIDLAALKGAFSNLIDRTGSSLEGGLSIISDHAGRPINSPETETADFKKPIAEDNIQARDNQHDDNRPNFDDSRREVERPDRGENNRERESSRHSENNGEVVRSNGDTETIHRSEERPQDQNQSASNIDSSNQSTSDSNGAGSDHHNSNKGEQKSQDSDKSSSTFNEDISSKTVDLSTNQVHNELNNSGAILGEMLAAAKANFNSDKNGIGTKNQGENLSVAEANFNSGKGDIGATGENNLLDTSDTTMNSGKTSEGLITDGDLLTNFETNHASSKGIQDTLGQDDINTFANGGFGANSNLEGLSSQVDSTIKPEKTLQGLAKAIASLGNNGAQQQSNEANSQNQSPELQALARAIVGSQSESKSSIEIDTAANSKIQQQAQGLSQKIGDGNKAQINVNVANESATLASQTSASLSPNGALASDSQGLPLRAQQAQAAANNPGGQLAGLNNASQNQQANNQSAQQAINTAATDVKAAGQISPSTTTNGGSSGSGEGSSATGSQNNTQETREAQQSNQPQASNTNKSNAQRQSAMDQITVNITRAVQSGLDKISIQLQPESLGKVDVGLEMAKDGKITAVIHAENKDTLDLLSRDAKDLTKALQEAGLKLDESDIKFNLGGQNNDASEGKVAEDASSDINKLDEDELAENDFIDEDIIENDRVNIRV